MEFSKIQKITDEECNGNLTDNQNKVKLYEKLDKDLEGIDDDFTEYLVENMEEFGRQNNIEA